MNKYRHSGAATTTSDAPAHPTHVPAYLHLNLLVELKLTSLSHGADPVLPLRLQLGQLHPEKRETTIWLYASLEVLGEEFDASSQIPGGGSMLPWNCLGMGGSMLFRSVWRCEKIETRTNKTRKQQSSDKHSKQHTDYFVILF